MSEPVPYSKLPVRDRKGAEQAIKVIVASVAEALGLPKSQRADIARQIRKGARFRL